MVVEKFQQLKNNTIKTLILKFRIQTANTNYIEIEAKASNRLHVVGINGIIVHIKDLSHKEMITDKTDSLITRKGEDHQLKLEDFIDFEELHKLMEKFYDFNKIPIGIVDLQGNILSSIGMTEICGIYHRKNKLAWERCIESDLTLTKGIKKNEVRHYKCLNNMHDAVTPIFVAEMHLANLFIGQFFYEDEVIEREVFRKQAKEFGIDEEKYLSALDKAPRLDRDKIELISSYYSDLIKIITSLAHSRLKLLNLNQHIEEREDNLQQITNNMTDVVFTADFDFNIKYISPSIEKLTGYTPEEYIKLSMEERYPIIAVKEIREAIALELEQDKTSTDKSRTNKNELVLYNKKKKMLFTSIHSKFLRDMNGNPVAIIANISNITKQIEVEKKLDRQLKLHSILTSMAVKYINIPTNEINKSINDSLASLATFVKADRAYIFDYDWNKQISVNTYEWVAEGITPEIENLQEVALSTMEYWPETHKQGKTIFIKDVSKLNEYPIVQNILLEQGIKSLITIPLMNNNECNGFVGFDSVRKPYPYSESEQTLLAVFAELLVNLENKAKLENDLREEQKKAKISNLLKSNLLKNISHEFRTPLNGIVGFSELLQKTSDQFETGNMASMIYSSAIRLNHVLDSIMLLNELEDINKKKRINCKLTNISSVLSDITSLYARQFKDKRLNFIVDIEANLYAEIDEKLLSQALIHLLNNALKFTHQGHVKLVYSAKDKEIFIDVIDSGIGIPQESLEIIFSEFRQASEGYNRAFEGVGLGLTISQRIVDLMQGRISVKSNLLEGSTFTIALPRVSISDSVYKNFQEVEEQLSIKPQTNKPKVLIVEDNLINQKLAISILKKEFITDLAISGEVAIILAEKKKYDIILMDIHLGVGIDGLTAAKAIKHNSKNTSTPIIAVTGYTMEGDKEKILTEGCDYYLGKPYKKLELLKVLNQAISLD